MSIGQKIIELRKARGLSRTELANIMGIPYPTWSKYEKDERQIDHALLIVLADFFDVTTDLLLGRQTEAVKEEGLFYNLSEEEKRAVRGHADSYRYRKNLPKDACSDSPGLTNTDKEGIKPQLKRGYPGKKGKNRKTGS